MNTQKYDFMVEGGLHLAKVTQIVSSAIKPGITLLELDALANNTIVSQGDYPSFKTVPNYHHATCINLNDGIVHGLPNQTVVQPGDIVSVDVGLIHKDYHLDTSITLQVPPLDGKITSFLETGKSALKKAVKQALPGNSIYQISEAIQTTIESAGYSVIRDLTGHGIGHHLHESPSIPCFRDSYYKKEIIKPGQALAIEIMYAMGDYHLSQDSDGWTIRTRDHSLTALFEDTVFITANGPEVLTSL